MMICKSPDVHAYPGIFVYRSAFAAEMRRCQADVEVILGRGDAFISRGGRDKGCAYTSPFTSLTSYESRIQPSSLLPVQRISDSRRIAKLGAWAMRRISPCHRIP
jgi:hypothetical protein